MCSSYVRRTLWKEMSSLLHSETVAKLLARQFTMARIVDMLSRLFSILLRIAGLPRTCLIFSYILPASVVMVIVLNYCFVASCSANLNVLLSIFFTWSYLPGLSFNFVSCAIVLSHSNLPNTRRSTPSSSKFSFYPKTWCFYEKKNISLHIPFGCSAILFYCSSFTYSSHLSF